jgi:predicted esterase
MEAIKHTFSTPKTARYFTSGNRSEKTKNIWIVCHGYGQLAENFIKKFHQIVDDENYIVSPEGLHRYYLDAKHEKIGASWMTREDRLDDIKDYVNLLDGILNLELKDFKGKVILFGFSQGVATVSRWYMMGKIRPDYFIMWAGVFPPDLPMEKEKWIFNDSKNFVVIGEQDEFFPEGRRKQVIQEIEEKGIKFDLLTFNGKHVINQETLLELKNRL